MKEKTYEQAMARLEELAEILEDGGQSLDESLKTFAEAVELIKFCHQTLGGAKKQMQILVDDLQNGLKEIEFNPEEYRG